MKKGGCKFGDGKTRGCPWPKKKKRGGGTVVSKWVPKLKGSVPPNRGFDEEANIDSKAHYPALQCYRTNIYFYIYQV